MQKKEKIKWLIVAVCLVSLQSCFNFKEYNADKYFQLEHTMEVDQSYATFLVQRSEWYLVKSKQTEITGEFDSLKIENMQISLYKKSGGVILEQVIRDADLAKGYNTNKLSFFSENGTTKYYYTINYLDSSNMVLSIDNYSSKWKKKAWFQFSKYKNGSL